MIGKGQLLRDGTDLTMISTGSTTVEALQAADALAEKGRFRDGRRYADGLPDRRGNGTHGREKTGRIMTVEEHYVHGGLGTMVAEVCAENYRCRSKCTAYRKSMPLPARTTSLCITISSMLAALPKQRWRFLKK